jgi:hypothetical protein
MITGRCAAKRPPRSDVFPARLRRRPCATHSAIPWQVAREAALSLSRLQSGDDERVAALLLHELADLRIAAAVALGESQNPAWIARLEPLLNDPDTGMHKSARCAIERLASLGYQITHS